MEEEEEVVIIDYNLLCSCIPLELLIKSSNRGNTRYYEGETQRLVRPVDIIRTTDGRNKWD